MTINHQSSSIFRDFSKNRLSDAENSNAQPSYKETREAVRYIKSQQKLQNLSTCQINVMKIREIRNSIPVQQNLLMNQKLKDVIEMRRVKVVMQSEEVKEKKALLEKLLKKQRGLKDTLIRLEDDLTAYNIQTKTNSSLNEPEKMPFIEKNQKNSKLVKAPSLNTTYTSYFKKNDNRGYKDFVEYSQDVNDWKRRKKMLLKYESKMRQFNDGSMDLMLNNVNLVKI